MKEEMKKAKGGGINSKNHQNLKKFCEKNGDKKIIISKPIRNNGIKQPFCKADIYSCENKADEPVLQLFCMDESGNMQENFRIGTDGQKSYLYGKLYQEDLLEEYGIAQKDLIDCSIKITGKCFGEMKRLTLIDGNRIKSDIEIQTEGTEEVFRVPVKTLLNDGSDIEFYVVSENNEFGLMSLNTESIEMTFAANTQSGYTYEDPDLHLISGIEIANIEDVKTSYTEGENFDPTGMIVQGYFYRSWREPIVLVPGSYTISHNTNLSVEEPWIEISYRGHIYTLWLSVYENFDHIEITAPPAKTAYISGDIFDKSGMVVTGFYSDGSSNNITYYTVDKQVMQLGDMVTVSYGSLNAIQPVSVIRMLDYSNHSRLKAACGAGEASVNLYNGTMTFNHPDIAVGLNTYQIGASHIYNSQLDYILPPALRGGAGENWKLNVEQYCYPFNNSPDSPYYCKGEYELGFRQGDYVYIDSAGYKHRFVKLERTNTFYDKTGLGLTMVPASEAYGYYNYDHIEDSNGNKIYFSENRVCLTENYYDPALKYPIKKRFEYENFSNGKKGISKIYDTRKPNRYLLFNNDSDTGELISIKSVIGGQIEKTISYHYNDDNRLVRITEAKTGETRENAYFIYDNENSRTKMTYAIDAINFSTVKFQYMNDKIYQMAEGVLDPQTADNPVCDGAIIYGGFVQKNYYNFSYYYSKVQTQVSNEKGIALNYFFNKKGFTTSIFEKKGTGYVTLDKETGFLLSDSGNGEKINENGSTVGGAYIVSANKINELNNYLRQEKNKACNNYILSFWLKYKSATATSITEKAKIHITHQNPPSGLSNSNLQAELDYTAVNAWQQVMLPVELVSHIGDNGAQDVSVKGISIVMPTITDFEFADIRVTPGQTNSFALDGAYRKRFRKGSLLNRGQFLSYKDESNTFRYKYFDKEFFVTEEDVVQIYYNIYEAQQKNLERYTLVHNGGTCRIANIKELFFEAGIDYAGFAVEPIPGESGVFPNYVYSSEPVSGHNRTYMYTAFVTEQFNGKNVECLRQDVHTFKYPRDTAASEQVESVERTWMDYLGRTLKKTDAYGVTTENTYDDCGNLIRTQISGQDTAETIINEFIYDADMERLIGQKNGIGGETLLGSVSYNANSVITGIEQPAVPPTYAANTTSYNYNVFEDRLTEVALYAGNNLRGKNSMTYDSKGRLSAMTPFCGGTSSYEYRIGYNDFGEADTFTLNGTTMLTKQFNRSSHTTISEYHRSASTKDKITTITDKYGRLKNVKYNNETKLTATYEDEHGSFAYRPSCGKIKTMQDSCDGKSYSYDYDEHNGQLKGYTIQDVKTHNNGSQTARTMNVKSIGDNKTKYDFGDWVLDYEQEIKYDGNCLISPRVTQVTDNNSFGQNFQFEYDKLGRLSKTTGDGTKTITYKEGTGLKERTATSFGSNKYENINHVYDNRGNLLSVSGNFKHNNFWGVQYQSSYNNSYEYNDINQLRKEINAELGFTRQYSYNTEGNVSFIQQGSGNYSYEYSRGRLEYVRRNSALLETYVYDNCGNPTRFKGGYMTWERGNLLSEYITVNNKTIRYIYDAQGRLYKKWVPGVMTHEYYYDGNKLLAKELSNGKKLRFFYDIEGIAGFKDGSIDKYTFVKDAQGNVLSLMKGNFLEARYLYDAQGNCTVLDIFGNVIADVNHIARVNPIRWKSQYYDEDSGLYMIGTRFYDPAHGRYISAASPETLLAGTQEVFGLNPYIMATDNIVGLTLGQHTCFTSEELYYDGEYKTWWDRWGKWVILGIGVFMTVAAAVATALASGGCSIGAAVGAVAAMLGKIAAGTAAGALVSLIMGGTTAGLQSIAAGNSFWVAFARHAQENALDELLVSFAVTATFAAAFSVVSAVKNFGKVKCFAAGTLVLCKDEDGEECKKKIEDIEVGDKVWAYDEETGTSDWKPVVQLFRNKAQTSTTTHFDCMEEPIVSTPEHPYYVLNASIDRQFVVYEGSCRKAEQNGQWVEAKELKIGDKCLLNDDKTATITSVKTEHLSEPFDTFNFEVEDFHTYYVGEQGILVHNTCVKSRIHESDALVKEAQRLPDVQQREVNHLVDSFKNGNRNPGIGNRHLRGDIYYLRGKNGARVFFNYDAGSDVMYLLGKAWKGNETKVMSLVLKTFGG